MSQEQERPLIRGTLCYASFGNQVPMILRCSRPNDFHYMKYVAPGGGLEPGETLEQCARREVGEELGVGLKTIKRLGTVLFNNLGRTFNGKAKDWNYECEIYSGELESLPTQELTDTGDKVEIYLANQIAQLPQHQCDLEILRLVQQGREFRRAEFIHEGEILKRVIIDYL